MNILDSHFSREEVACKCGCGFDTVDAELLNVMEKIRDIIGPYQPSSVCRCIQHNRNIGSNDTSQHVKAKACDVPTKDPKSLYEKLDIMYPNKYGIGLYDSFVHIDVRSHRARW
jgi:zinc D-Ala-D-Ala carboxypeptidase